MTDWNQHEDAIDDAISDSIDMDWTSRTGAKAVVAWLNENATSMTRDAEHTPSSQSVVVPVEPTEAMLSAAFDAFEIDQPKQYADGTAARKAIWSAMLAAAPAPSSLAGGEDVQKRVERIVFEDFYGSPVAGSKERLAKALIREFGLAALSPEAPAREAGES